MAEVFKYDKHNSVEVGFGNIIFTNDFNAPFNEKCFIDIEHWGMVKLFIDIKIKENEQDKNARNIIGG